MNFLLNAFSIQMLDNKSTNVSFKQVDVEDIPNDIISLICHQDTANVLTDLLGFEVKMNRLNTELENNTLYIAQLNGGRLPECSITLPHGYSFSFWKVQNLV